MKNVLRIFLRAPEALDSWTVGLLIIIFEKCGRIFLRVPEALDNWTVGLLDCWTIEYYIWKMSKNIS